MNKKNIILERFAGIIGQKCSGIDVSSYGLLRIEVGSLRELQGRKRYAGEWRILINTSVRWIFSKLTEAKSLIRVSDGSHLVNLSDRSIQGIRLQSGRVDISFGNVVVCAELNDEDDEVNIYCPASYILSIKKSLYHIDLDKPMLQRVWSRIEHSEEIGFMHDFLES